MTEKKEVSKKAINRNNIIMGVGDLLVVLSISYSTAVILIGTDNYALWSLLVPQAFYAAWKLIKQFTK
jgi:hypothetical protein